MTDHTLTDDQMRQLMPFAAHLGIELAAASPDEVVGRLSWAPHLTTVAGILHGGVLMSLADCVGATCAFLNLPEGSQTSTTSSNIAFLRAVRDGFVTATARPLHVGRSTIAVEVDVTDDTGRRVARVTQSQAVLTTEPG